MTQELDALLARVDDPALRADLARHIDRVKAKRQFGLVFENHLPETVRLPSHPVRRGSLVTLRSGDTDATWVVERVSRGTATLAAEGEDPHEVPVADLVVLAEFGTPIYPGLKSVGSVQRGGDKPSHVVINGENHHALEALQFTHAGKVDCIYIDPPYNTGARDWKYNNDYVDADDGYRHSKWLSMMERRIQLASNLLRPNGVLIVTIDEHEVNRLGILLTQLLAKARIQMVSIVINPSGVSSGGLSRVDEYAFYCFFGGAQPVALERDLLTDEEPNADYAGVRWLSLMRGGSAWYRSSRPNLCYPILIDDGGKIVGTGDRWDGEVDETLRPTRINGYHAAWPVRADGRLGIWRVDPNRLMYLAERGFAHTTGLDSSRGTWTVLYLLGGTVEAIESDELTVVGRGRFNEAVVEGVQRRTTIPKTVWKSGSHTAGGQGGTVLLRNLLGERNRFTYPKSLYAVTDALAAAIGDRPDAVVLDFFGGSGTTVHAVARLNQADGGRRQAILVTNNEVSDDAAARLRSDGFLPGDREWEEMGIFNYVTRPRLDAAISGLRPDGEPIPSTTKYIDGRRLDEGFEENVDYFELTYQDAQRVELDLAFEAVAPLLWMRAGSVGPIVGTRTTGQCDPLPYAFGANYGVLFDTNDWRGFVDGLPADASTAFVVTDSTTVFAAVSAELPPSVESVRLYSNYLSTFEINRGEV